MYPAKLDDNLSIGRSAIFQNLELNDFKVHFQPIYSAKNGTVYGYESLSRIANGKGVDIGTLFKHARSERLVSSLDMLCRGNALKQAAQLRLTSNGSFLFLNVCPETLMDPSHRVGITDALAEEYGISKEKIILEITEKSVIENYNVFNQIINYYRNQGYKIAIDDFGAGYGGLKMLSIIEPDFVKIDIHFLKDIDTSAIKFNLVYSMATACRKLGIKVVAEGVEKEDECRCVLDVGVDLLQGFYLHKPALDPSSVSVMLPARAARDTSTS